MNWTLNLICAVACTVLLGCGHPPTQTSSSLNSAATIDNIDQAWKAAEAQNADPKAQAYARQWTFGSSATWNDNGIRKMVVMPHERAILECVTAVFPTPTSAKLVFALDEKGQVTRAFSDQTGYSAQCIQSKLVGHRVPAPPTAPFYLCTQYQKRGESGSTTTSCGPRPSPVACESKGTTTTCTTRR